MEKKAFDLQLGDVLYWDDNGKAVVTSIAGLDGSESFLKIDVCRLDAVVAVAAKDFCIARHDSVYAVVDRVTPATWKKF